MIDKQPKNLNPQQILDLFKRRYPSLSKTTLTHINSKLGQKYHGMTQLVLEKQFNMEGKKRYKNLIDPVNIQLNLKMKEVKFVLLHEIAHCLVPYYERKVKNQWVKIQHDRQFYKMFMEIIKYANHEGIYTKQFDDINHLMQYDRSI